MSKHKPAQPILHFYCHTCKAYELKTSSTLPANRGAHLLGIAMKAGYPQAIETTNQSVRIRF